MLLLDSTTAKRSDVAMYGGALLDKVKSIAL